MQVNRQSGLHRSWPESCYFSMVRRRSTVRFR